jgi:hypothetical protein
VSIKAPSLEKGHEQGQYEEGQPTSNKGPCYNGQGLGGLAFTLDLKGYMFFHTTTAGQFFTIVAIETERN